MCILRINASQVRYFNRDLCCRLRSSVLRHVHNSRRQIMQSFLIYGTSLTQQHVPANHQTKRFNVSPGSTIHPCILTYYNLSPLFPWRDGRPISLLSFQGFFPGQLELEEVSAIKASAGFGASYATRYTRTLILAETVLTRLVTCILFSSPFAFFSVSAPTASLQTLFYYHNFIGIACILQL